MELNIEYLLKAKDEGLSTDDYINLLLIYNKQYDKVYIQLNNSIHAKFLEQEGFIKILGNSLEDIVIREKFIKFVPPISTNKAKEVKVWFDEWFNLFQEGQKAGSGMYIRSDQHDALDKMVRFVTKYKYSKETIIEATKEYLRKQKLDGYKFCSTANYLIFKQGRGSLLAAECENYNKQVEIKSMRNVI